MDISVLLRLGECVTRWMQHSMSGIQIAKICKHAWSKCSIRDNLSYEYDFGSTTDLLRESDCGG